jgi:hypothetical protein
VITNDDLSTFSKDKYEAMILHAKKLSNYINKTRNGWGYFEKALQ